MRTNISRDAHAAAYPLLDRDALASPVPAHDHGGIIEWVNSTPLPDVFESNSEAAWREWDEAVKRGAFAIGGAA